MRGFGLRATPGHIKTLPYEFGMPWMEPESNSRNFYDYADGVDRKTFSAMTEIIGTDSWADNPHDRYGRLATDLPYQSAYFSLLKGYNPDKWIFDSEWHILRNDPPVAPPQCLDMVMTQNFVQGLRAGTFWVACPGIDQKLDLTSQPRLLMQAGLTTARLRSQSAYYDVLARRKRPVATLYSPRSRYLDGDRHVNSLLRLSEAALFAGVSYRLVDERDLPALSPGEVPLLLVPECHAPENGTASALRNYAALGGTVVLTGTSPLQGNGDSSPFRILPLPENPVAILPLLNRLYQELHLMPEIEITGENGKPIFGIQWHAALDKNGGHIIYATNMTRQNLVLHIKNAGKLLDLRNGKHIPATIKLNTWETFLGSSPR